MAIPEKDNRKQNCKEEKERNDTKAIAAQKPMKNIRIREANKTSLGGGKISLRKRLFLITKMRFEQLKVRMN